MDDLISRQAAIDAVSQALKRTFVEYEDIARTIIGKLPSAQPETHEKRTETHACDCIERQAAIDAIEQMQIPIMRSAIEYEQFIFKGMSEALNAVKDLPSSQPVRCKDCRWRDDYGHWLGCPVLNTDDDNFCSMAERKTDGN